MSLPTHVPAVSISSADFRTSFTSAEALASGAPVLVVMRAETTSEAAGGTTPTGDVEQPARSAV